MKQVNKLALLLMSTLLLWIVLVGYIYICCAYMYVYNYNF